MKPFLKCPLAGVCSGCGWIQTPYDEQLLQKQRRLNELWTRGGLPDSDLGTIEIKEIAPGGFRERVDLIIQNGEIGLFDLGRKKLIAIENCPQMAPGLQQLFDDVAADLPPISRGSLRLRVSPSGDRGVWLDFSNEDIKNLLRQRDWIERMRIRGVLEIGQKRKRVVDKIGGLGLGAPEAHPWTLTPLESRDASLYSSIGSFTQAGTRANRAIVSEFLKLIPVLDKPTWLELGAGIGTLTLPLAEKAQKVIAIENDLLALAHLRQSAEAAGLLSRIETVATNFYASTLSFASYLLASHGVVADPPRSGLGIFLSHLAGIEPSARPKHFIYVSCATESFTHDAKTLYSLGYRLGRMVGVDQFPQTPHCEWLSYFYR